MILDYFDRVVVETLLEDAGVDADPALERSVQDFVSEGLSRMPAHLRIGVASVAGFLALESWARHGRTFVRLGPAERRSALRSWEQSRLDPIRQYVRLVRSLVLYGAYELPSSPPDR